MANYFTQFLQGAATGVLNPKGLVSNWQHGTRLFIDESFRLSPRTKFLYYARFEIDTKAVKAQAYTGRHQEEFNMLIKSAELPKFTFDSVVKNQYNRKKIIYKGINYDPISITMHDDSNGIVNALWALYYGYYIADRQQPNAAWSATKYRAPDTPQDNFRYGLDNKVTAPFFKSISIYTMSRRRFNGYTLVNPRIKSWSHGNMDYSASEFNDNTMTLEYEAVQYSTGTVRKNTPKGFATLHYDAVPSPLSVQGGGVATLTGDGGVLDGLESIFGDLSSGNTFDSFGGFMSTAIKSINTYKNFSKLSLNQIKSEAVNILSNPQNISTAISTVGGVVGAVFPSNTSTTQGTPSSPKKMLPDATGGTMA
jgi:hypothetical protein